MSEAKVVPPQIARIVENECYLRNMTFELIGIACRMAETHFAEGNSIAESIERGMSVAELAN